MTELHEIEVKALELLAIKPEPVGGQFDAVFEQLVKDGFALLSERGYEITEMGCDYLALHVPSSSIPNSSAPCGFVRL